MRHRCNIFDYGDLKSDSLNRADSGFAPGPRTLYTNLDFFKSVSHRLPAGVLSDHLSSVSCALTRTLEAHFPGARPSNHMPCLIGNAHDRVVEAGLNVRDPSMDILATFCLDNLDVLDHGIGIERKIFNLLF